MTHWHLNSTFKWYNKSGTLFFLMFILVCTIGSELDITEHNELCNRVIFKLSLFSQQNENGKWETHVQLDRGNESEGHETENDMQLDVKQTLVVCNCTNNLLSIEAEIVAPPLRPGKNYTLQMGLGYYYLQKTPYSWTEANHICNLDGAHLAVINSQNEVDYIKRLMNENESSISQLLIGLKRLANGDVQTILGVNHLPSYNEEWINNDTINNDTSTEHCGTINRLGKLSFVPCNQMLPFICEQEE